MCPVCRARFRGSAECSRCGADLTRVLSLIAEAWRLRRSAREALLEGDPTRARSLAAEAQTIHHTPAGQHLLLVGQALLPTG